MTAPSSRTHANPLAAERVLITGASGFLGSQLSKRLASDGVVVHAVSRSARRSELETIRWWQGDMADGAAARNIFHQVEPDVVFHFSGATTASPDRALVLPTLHSLLVSTVNVLLLASENECRRVVLAASLTEPMPNVADVRVGSPYAAAKWAGGVYAKMFRDLYEVPVVLLRPFMTYGPGQNESKLIPYVILSLLKGEAPNLSSGRQQVDWIYVDDVVEGFVAAACLPHAESRIIDLGSGTLVCVRDIVAHLVRLTGVGVEPVFDALPDRIHERTRVADLADARAILNWQPRIALSEGLARTVEYYRNKLISVL